MMTANAWYTVTAYHLRLDHERADRHVSNAIEKAVLSLNEAAGLQGYMPAPAAVKSLIKSSAAKPMTSLSFKVSYI